MICCALTDFCTWLLLVFVSPLVCWERTALAKQVAKWMMRRHGSTVRRVCLSLFPPSVFECTFQFIINSRSDIKKHFCWCMVASDWRFIWFVAANGDSVIQLERCEPISNKRWWVSSRTVKFVRGLTIRQWWNNRWRVKLGANGWRWKGSTSIDGKAFIRGRDQIPSIRRIVMTDCRREGSRPKAREQSELVSDRDDDPITSGRIKLQSGWWLCS